MSLRDLLMKNVRGGSVNVYVVDASVYAPLVVLFGRGLIEALRKTRIVILDLTVYESCNAYWKECVKFHRMHENEALIACRASKMLIQYINLHKITDLDVDEIMKIAIENNITFYDASYILLARELKAPIVSEDNDIVNIAPKYSIKVYGLKHLLNVLKQ